MQALWTTGSHVIEGNKFQVLEIKMPPYHTSWNSCMDGVYIAVMLAVCSEGFMVGAHYSTKMLSYQYWNSYDKGTNKQNFLHPSLSYMSGTLLYWICSFMYINSLYASLQWSWKWGLLVSPCPSVHLSVCLMTESCPLCIFNNTRLIHFIFTYLIKQPQKVYCM